MMTLHNNNKDFIELIQLTATRFGISPDFVEKDYWITSILKKLALSTNTGSIKFEAKACATLFSATAPMNVISDILK